MFGKDKKKQNRYGKYGAIGFIFNSCIDVPLNLREYYLSLELIKRGHLVKWFCEEKEGHYEFPYNIPKSFIIPRREHRIRYYPQYLSNVFKKHGIKYVWISGWYERNALFLLYLVLILRIMGYRILYDPIDPIHEFSQADGQRLKLSNEVKNLICLNMVYALADATFLVTEELRSALIAKGAPEKKLHVAYWGTDRARFNELSACSDYRHKYDLDNRFVIGWLGHMNPFKGISEVIIPLIKKAPDFIDNVCFLIGGKGELRWQFEQLVKEGYPLLLLDEVGYDDAPAFTASLDLYLVPINTETEFGRSIRPVKLFDAIAMGVPVVVTRTPATITIAHLSRGVNLVDTEFDSFLQAVLNIYQNYNIVKLLANEDKLNISSYTHESVSMIIADLIQELMARL